MLLFLDYLLGAYLPWLFEGCLWCVSLHVVLCLTTCLWHMSAHGCGFVFNHRLWRVSAHGCGFVFNHCLWHVSAHGCGFVFNHCSSSVDLDSLSCLLGIFIPVLQGVAQSSEEHHIGERVLVTAWMLPLWPSIYTFSMSSELLCSKNLRTSLIRES